MPYTGARPPPEKRSRATFLTECIGAGAEHPGRSLRAPSLHVKRMPGSPVQGGGNQARQCRVDQSADREGVYLNRTEQGLKPRFVKVEPPSDTDIAMVLQKISHRVIRTLRRLGYLEAGMDAAVATGYDPLLDNEPELARAMAASVKQRIAFGKRAREQVRRIGSGFGDEGECPILTGPCCASVSGFSLHANTQIPAHRRDQLERLMRYTTRGAVSLERLEEDANGELVYTFTKP